MILLDYKDKRPLYEQIVDKFQELILKGGLQVGDQLPSVRGLAMELSINPNTIQRAYSELEQKGFIYSVKGRGNYVSENQNLLEERKEEMKQRLRSQMEEARALGVKQPELMELLFSVYGTGGQEDD